MQIIPWQYVADWKCTGCGECCKLYSVVINFQEWLRIVKSYGAEQTAPGLDRLFLKRLGDGSCAFLHNYASCYACGLQHMKPTACKLWPFKVLTNPKYGLANEATYRYANNQLYVYVDSACNGIVYGNPRWEFANQILREFVEIALGICTAQSKSTGRSRLLYPYIEFELLGKKGRFLEPS